MKDLKRPDQDTFIYSPVTLFILVVFLVFLIISLVKIMHKNFETRDTRNQYKNELSELKKQEDSLQKDIDFFATERGMEEEIRDRFPVVKEGEELILIVDEEETLPQEPEPEKTFFQKIFQ